MARQNSAMLFDLHLRFFWQSLLASVLCLSACTLVAAACNFPTRQPTVTPSPVSSPTAEPTLAASLAVSTATVPPAVPYDDAGAVLAGLCFSFLQTLGSHTLVLDSPADLTKLYDAVDTSKQCRGTVERKSFDFSKRQIVGYVVTGTGCSVDLFYDHTDVDDNAHQRIVMFRSQISGDCPYDLVHPIWLAVERQGYTTQIRLSTSP